MTIRSAIVSCNIVVCNLFLMNLSTEKHLSAGCEWECDGELVELADLRVCLRKFILSHELVISHHHSGWSFFCPEFVCQEFVLDLSSV